MARIFRDKKLPGIAYSDLCRAATLQPDNAEVKKELEAKDLPHMSYDDILVLVQKLQFPESIIADMVVHTPLNFAKSADEPQQAGEGGAAAAGRTGDLRLEQAVPSRAEARSA